MEPGTELARDVCAGIGPLQLGVVLVLIIISFDTSKKQTLCTCIIFLQPMIKEMYII